MKKNNFWVILMKITGIVSNLVKNIQKKLQMS